MYFIVCPFCKTDFEKSRQNLICKSCKRSYQIQEDVPLIREGQGYFYDFEFSQENMRLILNAALEKDNLSDPLQSPGWMKALQSGKTQGLNQISNYAIRYSTDERRAGWKFILPMNKKSIVLDFGCGLGSISCSLARDAGLVISLDATFERAKFTQIRASQSGLNNVLPLCLNTKSIDLPFRDDYFDIIIINGVLEWIPCSVEDRNPAKIQLNQLKEIFRVLKPEGVLYLGIENRFGWSYWLGQKDHHTGLRFITLLPRPMAHLYSLIAKKTYYRNYLYSWWGYHRLLKKAGFDIRDIYLPFPTYAHFKYFINARENNLMDYLVSSSGMGRINSRIARYLAKTGIQKYISYSYGIVVVKPIG